ncbi:MAG: metal-dependent transcriptional regulator [Lachnospiraceae bacterium]|nr:metal-dependent transcriptional regulator [Lachnospiraceae bacterium]MBO7600001.1 metal-dependent transcriptional regulator [Lachnospiraceae bacterium]
MQESGEMYLETILVLSEKKANVRSIDIADYRNFSKPSVSRAVGKLKSENYINVDKDGYITLTKAGLEIANKIYERHQVLSKLLIDLGVSEQTAIDDACKIEHDISDETFNIIKKRIKAGKPHK